MDADWFWFNDEQWAKIVLHLPSNQPGPKRKDDRRILSGIMHVLKIGCRWQDCPKEYGPHKTIYNRFSRWSERGVGKRYLNVLLPLAARLNKSPWIAAMSKSTAAPRAEKGA